MGTPAKLCRRLQASWDEFIDMLLSAKVAARSCAGAGCAVWPLCLLQSRDLNMVITYASVLEYSVMHRIALIISNVVG